MFTNNTSYNIKKTSSNVYSGETLLTPIMLNPTADDIRSIKGLSADAIVRDPQYDVTIGGLDYKRVSLMCSYNPSKNNASLEDVTKYIDYQILVGKYPVKAASGKNQVIDKFMRTAWVQIKDGQTIPQAVEAAKKLIGTPKDQGGYSDKDPLFNKDRFDPESARVAYVGEAAIHELMFTISFITNNNASFKKDGFVLDMEPFFTGDLSKVNEILKTSEVFSTKGVINSFYGMMGVYEYNGNLAQRLHTPALTFNVQAIGKVSDKLRTTKINNKEYKFRIGYQGAKLIIDQEKPWDCFHKGFEFSLVTKAEFDKGASSNNSTTIETPGVGSFGQDFTTPGFGDTTPGLAGFNDDLPF